jgi:hypothetical protein
VVIVMDLHTRQLLDEAIALDDQARVEYLGTDGDIGKPIPETANDLRDL